MPPTFWGIFYSVQKGMWRCECQVVRIIRVHLGGWLSESVPCIPMIPIFSKCRLHFPPSQAPQCLLASAQCPESHHFKSGSCIIIIIPQNFAVFGTLLMVMSFYSQLLHTEHLTNLGKTFYCARHCVRNVKNNKAHFYLCGVQSNGWKWCINDYCTTYFRIINWVVRNSAQMSRRRFCR